MAGLFRAFPNNRLSHEGDCLTLLLINDFVYFIPMTMKISSGVVHELPVDLQKALSSDPIALAAWEGITPLARNEWICWVISVKKPETRREHVERVCRELKGGIRRPCCWIGCIHRTNKSLSPSQKFLAQKTVKMN